MAVPSAPCRGCGAEILRTKPTGAIPAYCGAECKPRCSVDGCGKPSHTKGWCSAHATRSAKYGDPLTPLRRSPVKGLACTVDGCSQPRRKREWCASHYAQWYTTGEATPFKFKWATEKVCVVCGARDWDGPRRKHCSGACAVLDSLHQGARPKSVPCRQCGKEIDLLATGKAGKRRKSDVKLCRRCKSDGRKYGMSVEQLATRDGTDCTICGETVDMDLLAPSPWRASVDHRTPRAHGGTHDPSNLALCHLWCNQVKSDREGFTLLLA